MFFLCNGVSQHNKQANMKERIKKKQRERGAWRNVGGGCCCCCGGDVLLFFFFFVMAQDIC